MTLRIERLTWTDIPLGVIKLPKASLELALGLGSGLSARDGRVFAVTDRGPNIFVSDAVTHYGLTQFEGVSAGKDAKILPVPDLPLEIVELAIGPSDVTVLSRRKLRTPSQALSGVAPDGDGLEQVFDLAGASLPADPLGVDPEAIAAMPDGSFFIAEEYGPSILKVDGTGVVQERWTPQGLVDPFKAPGVIVRDVLPSKSRLRRANRGFEALCASSDGAWLYAGLQSALPGDDQRRIPIFKLDAATGALAAEFFYPLDEPVSFRRDAQRRAVSEADLKVCEFAWLGDDRLLVLERIAHSAKIYDVSLSMPRDKALVMSSDDFPEIGPDIEGMTLLSDNEILLASDNDFGVEGAVTGFWRITLGTI